VGTSQASSHFSSDIGTGFVTDIRDIGGAIEIETTLSYASVPAWASGQVWIKRRNAPVLRNCTGCDEVRVASEAERKGKGFGEYFSYTFAPTNKAGRSSQSINMFTRSGKLKRIYMNVVKPMTGTAGAAAQFSDLNTFTASTMATPVTYQILLDLTVAGEREFTLSGLTGKTGNDAVTYDAVAQTALKADAWCETGFQGLFYNFAPSAKNLADLPIFVVVFEFDVGFFGQRITTKTDGTNHLVGIAGTIA
jgi:hypothetical protein